MVGRRAAALSSRTRRRASAAAEATAPSRSAQLTWWLQEHVTSNPPGRSISARAGSAPCSRAEHLRRRVWFCKRRRIEHDRVELLAGIGPVAQNLKCVGLPPNPLRAESAARLASRFRSATSSEDAKCRRPSHASADARQVQSEASLVGSKHRERAPPVAARPRVLQSRARCSSRADRERRPFFGPS